MARTDWAGKGKGATLKSRGHHGGRNGHQFTCCVAVLLRAVGYAVTLFPGRTGQERGKGQDSSPGDATGAGMGVSSLAA